MPARRPTLPPCEFKFTQHVSLDEFIDRLLEAFTPEKTTIAVDVDYLKNKHTAKVLDQEQVGKYRDKASGEGYYEALLRMIGREIDRRTPRKAR
jgi:hypothetical protein